jgi:hypothetical protein
VERHRSPRATLIVSAPAESSTVAEGRLLDVVTSVIAIAVLIGLLVLPVR